MKNEQLLYNFSVRGKFDLLKYVSSGKRRPETSGIFYDNGKMVATDGWILVAIDREYDFSMEGKTIDKNGLEVKYKFPNWTAIINNDCGEIHKLPKEDKYSEMVKTYKLMKRQGKFFGVDNIVPLYKMCDGVFLFMDKFILFYEACMELRTISVETYGCNRPIKAMSDRGVALLMPISSEGLIPEKMCIINEINN